MEVTSFGAGVRWRMVPFGGACDRPRLVDPRHDKLDASGGVGEAKVDAGVVGGVNHVVGARSLGVESEEHGEGGEASGDASGLSGCPVFGAIDWRKSLLVACVGVGASLKEDDGDAGESVVGGDVERGALSAVDVADRLGVLGKYGAEGRERGFASRAM